jgi:hypothetical protein
MSSKMSTRTRNQIQPGKTPPLPNPAHKANGRDTPLDPRIASMVSFLDRAIRTQNETVGVVVSAFGILLGRKGGTPDNLERLIYDVSMAMRVGFYLNHKDK